MMGYSDRCALRRVKPCAHQWDRLLGRCVVCAETVAAARARLAAEAGRYGLVEVAAFLVATA